MSNPIETASFQRPDAPEHVPGRLLVRFDSGAIADAARLPKGSSAQARLARLPASVEEPLSYLRHNAGMEGVEAVFAPKPSVRRPPSVRDRMAAIASVREVDAGAGVAVLELPQAKITRSLLKNVAQSPAVEVVEPMPTRWLFAAPDPRMNMQWGLAAIRYFQARRPDAKRVRVGVIDSGIDRSHPDLPQPALYRSMGFGSRDPSGHGTHVAGVIAALTNNGVGIAGICDAELAVWKVIPDGTRYVDSTAFVRALGEVATEEVDVVNLSLGGPARSDIEADLFAEAVERGVTFVAAMGNEYEEGNPTSYPAAYDDVVSVGAVNEARARSAFSNTGPHIDLCAPGSNILSTVPTTGSPVRTETGYASWNGTSMATPHVAAAAALLRARDPRRSPGQIADRLRKTAVGVPEMNGAAWTEAHGAGLLNLRVALP
jgi:subtilisin family serine protease